MYLNPYLSFDGNCEAAFNFYEQTFGGETLAMMRFGDTPACGEVPADHNDKIMHARLKVEDSVLMGSDCIPGHPHESIKGCDIAIQVDDPAEAERIFNALSADGTIKMPLQETFWAARFGMLVDQFGVPWLINCESSGDGCAN